MEFPASLSPAEYAETRPLDASRVTSSGRDRFLAAVAPTVSGSGMRRKERREAGCVEAGAAKRKEVEKEALGGNGSGSGKSAWEDGGDSETESARSEAPPRRVRLRREKDGKEKEMGVSAALEDGARRTTTRRRTRAAVAVDWRGVGAMGMEVPNRARAERVARAGVLHLWIYIFGAEQSRDSGTCILGKKKRSLSCFSN